MGTNYYLHRNICECCSRYDELHIGKSSMGWTFSFQGYKADELPDGMDVPIDRYAAWLVQFGMAGEIYNEYGEQVSVDDFVALVEHKRNAPNNHTLYCREHHPDLDTWLDPDGHSFTGREFS